MYQDDLRQYFSSKGMLWRLLTLSYWYGAGDGGRIVVILDGPRQRIYQLWWDPEHRVSGTDNAKRAATVCAAFCLHPQGS